MRALVGPGKSPCKLRGGDRASDLGMLHRGWDHGTLAGQEESPGREKRGEGSEFREAEKVGPSGGGRTDAAPSG